MPRAGRAGWGELTALAERVEGRCRCGKLHLAVAGRPLLTMACHCTGCQRMTGSAFSLSSAYPADRFSLVAGEPVLGGLRAGTRHYFCGDCMSWLYTRPQGLEDFVNVRSTLLDDAVDYTPFIEAWTSEKLPWAATGAVHSFETVPEEASFPTLLAEYAEQTASP